MNEYINKQTKNKQIHRPQLPSRHSQLGFEMNEAKRTPAWPPTAPGDQRTPEKKS